MLTSRELFAKLTNAIDQNLSTSIEFCGTVLLCWVLIMFNKVIFIDFFSWQDFFLFPLGGAV